MLVELKNGETLNGHLVTCDNFMNLILREVVQKARKATASSDYLNHIRGNNVCDESPHFAIPYTDSHPDQIPTSPRGNRRYRQGTATEPTTKPSRRSRERR